MVQALKSKEIDFAYDIPPTLADSLGTRKASKSSTRRTRTTTRTWRSTSGARRRRTDRLRHTAGDAGNEQPRAPRPRGPAGDRARDRQAGDRGHGVPGRRATGGYLHLADKAFWHLDIPAMRNTTSTSRKRTRSSTTPGTRNARPTASGSIPRRETRSRRHLDDQQPAHPTRPAS